MNAVFALILTMFAVDPLPVGKSTADLKFGDVSIRTFTYKPKEFRNGPIIMVFHGVLRNAEEYRDDSIEMGDRFGGLIVAPLFDDVTFPKRKYQFGGIVDNGIVTPRDQWTGQYVNRISKEIREREGLQKSPLYLIGHSGGGQFLARLAVFVETDAKRIIASNAGTYTFPNVTPQFPYGLGGLPEELQTEKQLKLFLSQPLTLYLGSKDIERDEYLDVGAEADAQGLYRFERGQNMFAAGKRLAEEKNWPFNWKLVIANDVEHDHTKMFNHPKCADAFEFTNVK